MIFILNKSKTKVTSNRAVMNKYLLC